MTDYQQLAEEIRAKRHYREAEDGTIFCSLTKCPGSQGLRCQRTGVPICKQCAVRTPVGYICKEAAREQQNLLFNAQVIDYLVAGGAAFFMNLIAGYIIVNIANELGFFGIIITFFVATAVGGGMSEAILRLIQKRRGRYLSQVVSGAVIISSIIFLPLTLGIMWFIYTLVVVSTVNARFQLGIRLR